MSRAAKIITGAAATVVVAGLVALAAPAVVGTVRAATEGANHLARTLEDAPSAEEEGEPVAVSSDDRSGDWLNRPKSRLSCERYTDHGPNEYAEGTVVEMKGEWVMTYRVAEGDTYIGIMERFCTPSSAHISYANKGIGVLSPGQLMRIREYG